MSADAGAEVMVRTAGTAAIMDAGPENAETAAAVNHLNIKAR